MTWRPDEGEEQRIFATVHVFPFFRSAMQIEPLKTLPPLRSGGQSAASQKQKTKKPVSPPFIIVSVTAVAFPASLVKIP